MEAAPCWSLPFSVLFPALPSPEGQQDLGNSGGGWRPLVPQHNQALISLQKLQKYICNARIRAYKNNIALHFGVWEWLG